jgi:hypothetical protein
MAPTIRPAAGFSPCGRYRYWLTRTWDTGKAPLCWVLLNPSTADDRQDDPTIRRCMSFARSLGYGGIHVVNLFAFRATRPRQLRAADDPVGPANDRFIVRAARRADRVIAAWGCHGAYQGRDREVMALLAQTGAPVACLGMTRDGWPRHPLYLPGDAVPVPFTAANAS